jgi:hypothetical protein
MAKAKMGQTVGKMACPKWFIGVAEDDSVVSRIIFNDRRGSSVGSAVSGWKRDGGSGRGD